MKNFCIALAIILLIAGCATDPEPCTPELLLSDGTTVLGPYESGLIRIEYRDFARKETECSYEEDHEKLNSYTTWLETEPGQKWKADWELRQEKIRAELWLESKTDHTGYNLSVPNEKISEDMILQQYEAEPSEHPNSSTYISFDETESKRDEPIWSLVRGPSLRSEDEACKKEMIKDGVFSQVSKNLEIIRNSENLTFDKVKELREKIMFQGDNWYWPNSDSACSKSNTNMTYRTQYRSSEKPSDFGKNTTCPGNETFDKISNDNSINFTENYDTPRSLPTVDEDRVNLEYYPSELQVCKDKCFSEAVVDEILEWQSCYWHYINSSYHISNSCYWSGKSWYTDGEEIWKTCQTFIPGNRWGSWHKPRNKVVIERNYYGGRKITYAFNDDGICHYYKGFEIRRRKVYKPVSVKVPYKTEKVISHKSSNATIPEIRFFGTEEERIACTKCEAEQYSKMCRFPKNEIFIVRKK